MRASIVHLVVQRVMGRPNVARWYVRHVWWDSRTRTHYEAVVAEGEFDAPAGRQDARAVALAALEAALADLRPGTVD